MIRVLVIENHELVRVGICRLLERSPEIVVVAHTGSGHEAVELSQQHEPDVVILDDGLPDLDCLETIRVLNKMELGLRILVLTTSAHEGHAIRVLRAGAAGCISKTASAPELLDAVREVKANGIYASPANRERIIQRIIFPWPGCSDSALSERESQVLVGLARGMTTKEVAASLALSHRTAVSYRSRILGKLGLRNDSDMTRFAIRCGLIEVE